MVLTLSKRVVTGICTLSLLTSHISTNTKYDNNTAAQVATGCAIGAGILALAGAVATGIYYCCNKSDEQILEDAYHILKSAHKTGKVFRDEYMDIIQSAYYNEPDLNTIERVFLSPIALEAVRTNFPIITHIDTAKANVSALRNASSQVSERIRKLEKESLHYTPIYRDLQKVRSDIAAELEYLEGYAEELSRHSAFFELYLYESKLCKIYAYELEVGHQYEHHPHQLASCIILNVGSHVGSTEYPLLAYHKQLTHHIHTLELNISQLRYYYPSRLPLAQKLLGYLKYMRSIVETYPAFKEEKYAQKAAEDRATILAYQARQTAALEAQAHAAQLEASAQWARAVTAQQQPHVSITVRS
jgi:hypothetical protein